MAQLRIVRPTRFKFGMAYLRWGPLCERRERPLDPEIPTRIALALEEEYVGKRKLFLRVLPNAFAGSTRAVAIQSAFRRFTREPLVSDNTYRTFVLDLTPGLEELRRGLDKKWRNQLSSAEKKGLKVVAGNGNDQYRIFCQMYDQMRKRKTFETTVDVRRIWPDPTGLIRVPSDAGLDLRGWRYPSGRTGGLGDGRFGDLSARRYERRRAEF